jgi:4-amino-4-deoxy-L-arabinose transferase-like glycosyltransferase
MVFLKELIMKYQKIWIFSLLIIFSILALLPASPVIQSTPPRDSGIFLYVGSRLLKGDLLYKAIWDDKPPLIFWINAFGLWLSPGSTWGVWILEAVGILATVWMAFSMLKKAFGSAAAALGIVSGLTILLITLHGGNYTEEYAIPFQIASLFFLVQSERRGGNWQAIGCGIALGLIFFLRQNLIGIGAAIVIYLIMRALFKRSWLPIKQGAFIALGFIGVSIIILTILAIQGIIPEFWDAAFVFSLAYSNLGLLEHLKALGDTLRFFSQIPFLLIFLPAWFLAAFLVLRHGTSTILQILRNRWTGWVLLAGGILGVVGGFGGSLLQRSENRLGLLQQAALIFGFLLIVLGIISISNFSQKAISLWLEKKPFHFSPASTSIISIAVIWFPIELVMVNLSGRSYLHYYMAMCAIGMVMFAFLADRLIKLLGSLKAARAELISILIWSIAIVLTLVYNPINTLRIMYTPEGKDNLTWKAVRYVVANTQPDDKVLIWGAEPVINFLSDRSSPLRYPYFYPFYTINYGRKALTAEVLEAVQHNKPVLIIYTGDTPFVNINADGKCKLPDGPLPAGMDNVLNAVCLNYHYAGELGKGNWKIYQVNP